jgi:predicted ATPase
VQLLVETHSDHVLNGVRVAVKKYQLDPERVGLYFFERAEEQLGHQTHIIQPKLDKDGRIDSWPRGFFDEWNRNLRELL